MRYGSLCSGYGGLDLAAEHVFGATAAWHAEVDPHASKILAHHWPDVPNLGDLTAVDWSQVEPVDVLCAGYPCQPFSTAGKRKGTDDERHLWPYIADAVRVLRPGYVVCENVAGHLGLGFDAVLADLAGLGFDVEWSLVRASEVGAPHRRERLFFVAADASHLRHERGGLAWHRGTGPAHSGLAAADTDSDGLGRHAHEATASAVWARPVPARPACDPERQRAADFGPYAAAIGRWEHLTGRTAPHPAPDGRLSPPFVEWMMGLPDRWVTGRGLSRTAELRMLGNGVVPQQAAAAIAGLLARFTEEQAA